MTPFEPLGPAELAQRWGVTRQRIHQLVETDPRLKDLSKVLARVRVWNLEDIERYEQETGRKVKGSDDDLEASD